MSRAPYFENDQTRVYAGNCLELLPELPPNSVDGIVTDPPYGLANTSPAGVRDALAAWLGGDTAHVPEGKGFMGEGWDAFVPPPAVWAEALRVAKPGAHAFVFAGSRTQDLMALSMRLGGWDLRDTAMWVYSTGFPKSRDLSAPMADYLAGGGELPEDPRRAAVLRVTAFLKAARDAAGWSNARIDELFGTSGMAGHWTTQASQPAVPSVRQWAKLKEVLGFGDELDELVAELGATERPEDWGSDDGPRGPFLGELHDDGAELGDTQSWGTALKPAYEPVLVARKPFPGSATANARKWGTGGLHLDAIRVPYADAADLAAVRVKNPGRAGGVSSDVYGADRPQQSVNASGRWPSNVLLDEGQAAELDRQSGAARVSRAMPVFRYSPKAPTHERPNVDGVTHPTVKPLSVMRWLVRASVPQGGTVLDMFAGSGTTLEAAALEHVQSIGFELTPRFLPLIRSRFEKALEPVLQLEGL